jgi:hypothetical protein
MKSLLALALIGFAVTFCNLGKSNNNNNANNSNNSNNSKAPLTPKDRFVGTWVATDTDFNGGPITFKSDNTYSAQNNNNANSSSTTGTYEIRNERLYCKGELEDQTKDGFKLDGDRISLKMDDKTVYFRKR